MPSRRIHPAVALLVLASVVGCDERRDPSPPPHDGPIVLFTLEGLRADAVGALGGPEGLTPNLDRLARRAAWAGRAVAPSSGLGPCLASLFTGLRPWQHQVVTEAQASLPQEAVTLAEALAALGYQTQGFHEAVVLAPGSGWGQGFSDLDRLGRGNGAAARLRALPAGRTFVWIHLAAPNPPYLRRDALAPRVGEVPAGLRRRLGWADLEPFFDPAVSLPAGERDRLVALYRFNVAWADLALGRFLRALADSGGAERALVAVVSLYGQEFGEHGQIAAGGNLGRAGIEVPLILALPPESPLRPAVPPGERVAVARLWATLVEAAGGTAPPGVAPSLFRGGPVPLLSELYAAGGHNEFSLVEGDLQLRWRRRFSELAAPYYRARLQSVRSPRDSSERQALRLLLRRLDRAWRRSLPLSGPPGTVDLRLERWLARGGVEEVDDREREAAMGERLRRAFRLFAGAERTPEQEDLAAP